MEAETPCELLECSAANVAEVIRIANPHAHLLACSYAAALVSKLENADFSSLNDFHSKNDYDHVVALMPSDARMLMSYPALQFLKHQLSFGAQTLEELEEEVQDGKCNLRIESERVLRVVHVVALQMRCLDEVCVQLGELRGDESMPSVELPGKKMRMLEMPMDSAQQLVSELFPNFAASISFSGCDTFIKERSSATYGIPTRYVRHVVQARMDYSISSNDLQMERCQWEDGYIKLSAFPESERGGGCCKILAWMSQLQYEKLIAMDVHNASLAKAWIDQVKHRPHTASRAPEMTVRL